LLGNLLKSIMLLEIMPNTTLPAVTVHTILVVRILLAYLVIDLLELQTFGWSFGENLIQGSVVSVVGLFELLLCALLLRLHR
jgi:hypothetical protein